MYFAVGRRLQAEGADVRAIIFRYSRWYCLLFLAGAAWQWNLHGFLDVTIVRDFVSPGSFLLVLCLFLLVKGRESWGALLRTPLFLLAAFVFTAQASRTYALVLAVLLVMPREIRVSPGGPWPASPARWRWGWRSTRWWACPAPSPTRS